MRLSSLARRIGTATALAPIVLLATSATAQQNCGCGSAISDGLVAYWPLEETSPGMLIDASGNGFHGTLGPTAILGIDGVVCKASGFRNRETDVGIIPFSAAFQFQGEFAVASWIRIAEFPDKTRVLPNGQLQQLYKIFGQYTGNQFSLNIDPDGDWVGTTGPQLTFFYEYGNDVDSPALHQLDNDFLNKWHFVVGQYNASTGVQELWLDGVLVTANQAPAPQINSSGHIGLGGESFFAPRVVNGEIDEVRLFDRALTPEEIQQLNACGSSEHVSTASGDTYLKQGKPNKNQGTEEILRLRQSGKNRPLVEFSQGEILSAVGSASVASATLRLHIDFNANNWGNSGREVGVHRMTDLWTELGATWKCGIDADTSNQQPNCDPQWVMQNSSLWPFEDATDIVLHEKFQTGWVEFDVTADVQAFVDGSAANLGWIIKKVNEGQAGHVQYSSREGDNPPELVIVTQ